MSRPVQPPRFVPTLTQVVVKDPLSESVNAGEQTAGPASAGESGSALLKLQETLAERVMQRVNLTLDSQLREAVGKVILEHAEVLIPRLRAEIEAAVSRSVEQALSLETASSPPPR